LELATLIAQKQIVSIANSAWLCVIARYDQWGNSGRGGTRREEAGQRLGFTGIFRVRGQLHLSLTESSPDLGI